MGTVEVEMHSSELLLLAWALNAALLPSSTSSEPRINTSNSLKPPISILEHLQLAWAQNSNN